MNLTTRLLHNLEDAVEFLTQRSHILPNLVVSDFSVDLGRGDMFMSRHLTDRFQRYALRKRNRRGEGMTRHEESDRLRKEKQTEED